MVNYAEATPKSLKETEKQMFDNKTPIFYASFKSDKPGVCRLVRTATKCFRADSKATKKVDVRGSSMYTQENFLVTRN